MGDVISEYRVPWLEIYKYPLPDGGLLRDFNQVVYCRGINSLVSVEIPKIKGHICKIRI
jgi:hypothetical protein